MDLAHQLKDVEPGNGEFKDSEVFHAFGGIGGIAVRGMRFGRSGCGLVFAPLTIIEGGPVTFAEGIPMMRGGLRSRAYLQSGLGIEKKEAAGRVLLEVDNLLRSRIGKDDGRFISQLPQNNDPRVRSAIRGYRREDRPPPRMVRGFQGRADLPEQIGYLWGLHATG